MILEIPPLTLDEAGLRAWIDRIPRGRKGPPERTLHHALVSRRVFARGDDEAEQQAIVAVCSDLASQIWTACAAQIPEKGVEQSFLLRLIEVDAGIPKFIEHFADDGPDYDFINDRRCKFAPATLAQAYVRFGLVLPEKEDTND